MTYLTKQYKFCAAHRYWNPNWSDDKNYEIFGEDVRIHGHNYILDITLSGPIDENSGFICNLFELNELVQSHVLDVMDHSQIQLDIPWFELKQPSTENMVVFIWEQIESKIPRPANLYSIKLRETPTIFTEYFGPEGK
ncbi:MAG: 6-carboxytetrahydropterin synthase [Candidatus Marinimicrobia bacterium]|jgi:6-pyruvoyltetrahydropterin/6-carboxytetrahydropterin synthase|nr:6-carboxytetrahydropterin synthase [Candidatus Neomarinimicrobiota bacterium]|tara:strand:+ start:10720 stop:11133 length:414 start_codon:yes stop_codon:yes gene_type:complete